MSNFEDKNVGEVFNCSEFHSDKNFYLFNWYFSAQKLSLCYIDLTSFSITNHKVLSINLNFCTKFNFTLKKLVKSLHDKKIEKDALLIKRWGMKFTELSKH